MRLQEAVDKTICRYGGSEQFMSTFNPNMQKVVAENVERVYTGSAPSLTVLATSYGKEVALSWLEIELDTINDFAGVQKKTDMQELAHLILSEHYYLKVSEIMLFIHRFKAGRYGHFYGTVDCLIISSALLDYLKERDREIALYEGIKKTKERTERLDSPTCISYDEYLKQKEKKE